MGIGTLAKTLKTYARDLAASVKNGADAKSRLGFVRDFTLSRGIRLLPKALRNREREAKLRGGVRIRYRLNKGDLHSIRELWFSEEYRLPFANAEGVLLDLGANIGMASLWLMKRYGFTRVIAVEPDPTNAALVRKNFEENGIPGEVVEAAVGPADGTARFAFSDSSNFGKLSENGSPVRLISVDTILKDFAVDRFALIKIDIEDGEEAVFDGPLEWLSRTDAMILEFHPDIVDCERITKLVIARGFRFIPAHTVPPDNLPCFTRSDGSPASAGSDERANARALGLQGT